MLTRSTSRIRFSALWLMLIAVVCLVVVPVGAEAKVHRDIEMEGDPGDGHDNAGGGGTGDVGDGLEPVGGQELLNKERSLFEVSIFPVQIISIWNLNSMEIEIICVIQNEKWKVQK